jgi:hypothetical protein
MRNADSLFSESARSFRLRVTLVTIDSGKNLPQYKVQRLPEIAETKDYGPNLSWKF